MADYTDDDRLRLRELLPFYLNRTLDPARRQEVEAWLAHDANGRQELQFLQAVTTAARQRVAERAPLAGYEALAARLEASRPPAPAWWQRWWQGLAAARWAPVGALGVALIAVQMGWNVYRLDQQTPTASYRGTAAQPARAADLKLVVRRDARFADLAELLVQNRCHIVWGPSVSGELWIALDEPGSAEPVRARLAASPLVEDVLLVRR